MAAMTPIAQTKRLAFLLALAVSACGGGGGGDTTDPVVDPSSQPPVVQAVMPATDTGLSASQCYKADLVTLVSCTSADATSLYAKQDGMVGLDVTASDNSDGALGFSYARVKDDCVQDKVTGLIWEAKTNDTTPRGVGKRFTNLGNGAAGDASAYVTLMNTSQLCGFTDWRIPTAWELQSLLHYGATLKTSAEVAIDTAWFPYTASTYYWTSSGFNGTSQDGMMVGFGNGGIINGRLAGTYAVRLVRGGAAVPVARFIFSASGSEVTDTLTGLTWMRCEVGQSWDGGACVGTPNFFYFDKALAYAKGQTGWRIPNVKELASLIEFGRKGEALRADVFPNNGSESVWTITPNATHPENTWIVTFLNGLVTPAGFRSDMNYLRLVK
jgi:hypothetical protein